MTRPPAPVPASAPDTVFSAARALRHVEAIAQRPHPVGSADHDRVRDYISGELRALGLAPEMQRATGVTRRTKTAMPLENIVATLPGSVAGGPVGEAIGRPALLVVVHYDGVPRGPAAGDDGAAVAALLETLRALRASERARGHALQHDVIALFTDGEELGLLGAKAFVSEHPKARDAAFVLNFEARGTSGRSLMFETGPGNLDAARLLRTIPDVTAGSVFTTIYRTLPNDTDLSALMPLGVPAMNFAFIEGNERYHTAQDDVAHLNPGSLQHHGQQMLALTRTIANGTLPRPRTSDGVFFDFPLLGLVVYPFWVAYALGAVLMGLAVAIERRERRLSAGLVALFVFALLAVFLSVRLPAVSYLLAWPALFALIARRWTNAATVWVAAFVPIMLLSGLVYVVFVAL